MKVYHDIKGNRYVFASAGLGGDTFMSMYKHKDRPGKGMHRLKSPALPERNSLKEAQADLDAYAAQKCWRVMNLITEVA